MTTACRNQEFEGLAANTISVEFEVPMMEASMV